MSRSTGDASIDALYTARQRTVDFVDVPELGLLVLDGHGAPESEAFTEAVQALHTVSYTAHFAVQKATGTAPRLMPLQAQWWVAGTEDMAVMRRIAAGTASVAESDRDRWSWRAMIAQLPPIDEAVVEQAVATARARMAAGPLAGLRYERWAEGPSAQLLHVGPYATESASIAILHQAIAGHGARPHGRHHEIYLGDPRLADPDRLRTILRQPIEPAS